jgi:NADH-quinone oxidoreductase subunit M
MELQFLNIGILSWITFLPIIGLVVVLLLPKNNQNAVRWTSAFFTGLQIILAGLIYFYFDRGFGRIPVRRESKVDFS